MRILRIAPLLVTLVACDAAGPVDDDDAATVALDPHGWIAVEADADPYAARRPDEVACAPGEGFVVEDYGALEVRTGSCNWLSVAQPAPIDLPAGTVVTLRLWAIELQAPEPAVATIAVAVDGESTWTREIPIPSPTELIVDRWALERPVEAGAPVVFHVDNHGANTYALVELSFAQ
ncbi:MAG: hypothetical protein R3B09_19845 [Nannocystaceae bacterium]